MTQDDSLGPVLLSLSRAAISEKLGLEPEKTPDHAALHRPGASFVTLTKNGQLRGCIGQLEAIQDLGKDVRQNAIAAAFHDPRFRPVTLEEWPLIEIEVSVLGPVSFTPCPTEKDCLRQIKPFEDGVILSSGLRRATFLPQVWDQLPESRQFIEHLLLKAGLPVDAWPSDMKLGRYRVTKYL